MAKKATKRGSRKKPAQKGGSFGGILIDKIRRIFKRYEKQVLSRLARVHSRSWRNVILALPDIK